MVTVQAAWRGGWWHRCGRDARHEAAAGQACRMHLPWTCSRALCAQPGRPRPAPPAVLCAARLHAPTGSTRPAWRARWSMRWWGPCWAWPSTTVGGWVGGWAGGRMCGWEDGWVGAPVWPARSSGGWLASSAPPHGGATHRRSEWARNLACNPPPPALPTPHRQTCCWTCASRRWCLSCCWGARPRSRWVRPQGCTSRHVGGSHCLAPVAGCRGAPSAAPQPSLARSARCPGLPHPPADPPQDLKVAFPELGRGLQQLLEFEGDVEAVFCRRSAPLRQAAACRELLAFPACPLCSGALTSVRPAVSLQSPDLYLSTHPSPAASPPRSISTGSGARRS